MYCTCAGILQPEVEIQIHSSDSEMYAASACTHSGSPHNAMHSSSLCIPLQTKVSPLPKVLYNVRTKIPPHVPLWTKVYPSTSMDQCAPTYPYRPRCTHVALRCPPCTSEVPYRPRCAQGIYIVEGGHILILGTCTHRDTYYRELA